MFNSWAEFYKNVHLNKRELEGNICCHVPFIKEIARYVRIGDKVLEIGTGTGLIGYPISQSGVKVISIDNDLEILKMARENAALYNADIEYMEADAFHLPFQSREFRVSFSLGLLEHFDDDGIRVLITEHQKVADVVIVGMPVEGNKGRAFGNERWLTMEQWEHLLIPLGAERGFIYGVEPCCCFTFVREEARATLPVLRE